MALNRCHLEKVVGFGEPKIEAVESFKLGARAVDATSAASRLDIDLLRLVVLTEEVRI